MKGWRGGGAVDSERKREGRKMFKKEKRLNEEDDFEAEMEERPLKGCKRKG